MTTTALHEALRTVLNEGGSAQALVAAARAVDPELSEGEIFRLADSLADAGLTSTRVAPPVQAVGRREVLQRFVVGAAAAGAAAATFAMPRVAQAADDVCDPFAGPVDFRGREATIKRVRKERLAREEAHKSSHEQDLKKRAPNGASAEAKAKQAQSERHLHEEAAKMQARKGKVEQKTKQAHESRRKMSLRYSQAGPAPVWIETDDAVLFEAQVELSSVRSDGDGSYCTVTMDLTLDGLDKGNAKELVASFEKLAGSRKGDDAPYVAVTWGAEGDQAFEGFLEESVAAYDAFLADGTPARATVRATFLLA